MRRQVGSVMRVEIFGRRAKVRPSIGGREHSPYRTYWRPPDGTMDLLMVGGRRRPRRLAGWAPRRYSCSRTVSWSGIRSPSVNASTTRRIPPCAVRLKAPSSRSNSKRGSPDRLLAPWTVINS